jgi:hypothetical protein
MASLNLRQGLIATRNKIGELVPQFWSDDDLIADLNVSARRMCSAAQFLQAYGTFTTSTLPDGSHAQEYILPKDVDQIIGAAYFSGVVYPLSHAPRESMQLGGLVSGIPFYFYMKKQTKTLTHQTATGIESFPIIDNDSRTVIGLYPIPNTQLPVYIWYQQWHPDMIFEADECMIPDRFKLGWVAYAVARAKEKESDLTAAQYYDALHEKQIQEFVEYQITAGQEIMPPYYSNRQIPPFFLRGSNTVVVVAQNPGSINL